MNKHTRRGGPPVVPGGIGGEMDGFGRASGPSTPFGSPDMGFGEEANADLADLEHTLNIEVDEDFFVDPRYFQTLQRVITVLGVHVSEAETQNVHGQALLDKNPAYLDLKRQSEVVENAIEFMSRVYCNALNRSVIQVGRVATEVEEAMFKVQSLRRQVREIKQVIGARAGMVSEDGNQISMTSARTSGQASHMNLRELWLKKLESEYILSLLKKLDSVRDAPGHFDLLVQDPCRIAAGIKKICDALETINSEGIVEVKALNKIVEHLIMRKQTAEEILWDTLREIVFLRTGNGLVHHDVVVSSAPVTKDSDEKSTAISKAQHSHADDKSVVTKDTNPTKATNASKATKGTKHSVEGKPKDLQHRKITMTAGGMVMNAGVIYNPFQVGKLSHSIGFQDSEDISVGSQDSASLFSVDDEEEIEREKEKEKAIKEDELFRSGRGRKSAASVVSWVSSDSNESMDEPKQRMMIPIVMLEANVNIVEDERKNIVERTSNPPEVSHSREEGTTVARPVPRYKDPVLALRVLGECVVMLDRFSVVEENLKECLEKEVKSIVHKEQQRTFNRLERRKKSKRRASMRAGSKRREEDLKDLRRHLTNVLRAFGNTLVRLSHLAQILRSRAASCGSRLRSVSRYSNSILNNVIQLTHNSMQEELKEFLKACIIEVVTEIKGTSETDLKETGSKKSYYQFDMSDPISDNEEEEEEEGVDKAEQAEKEEKPAPKAAPKEEPPPKLKSMDISATKFVSGIMFPMLETAPGPQNALAFRRSLEKWNAETASLKRELSILSGGDSFSRIPKVETAVEYIDKQLQDNLIPFLQQSAVNGPIVATELPDAFDPPKHAATYQSGSVPSPLDWAMVPACDALHENTSPLIGALHRLPTGGEMFQGSVQFLGMSIEQFIARVLTKAKTLKKGKTADRLLEGGQAKKNESAGKSRSLLVVEEDDSTPKPKMGPLAEKRIGYARLLEAYKLEDDPDIQTQAGSTQSIGGKGLRMAPKPSVSSRGTEKGGGAGRLAMMKAAYSEDTKEEEYLRNLPEGGIEREQAILRVEITCLEKFLDFNPYTKNQCSNLTDDQLKSCAVLAHSLLKLCRLLQKGIKGRGHGKAKMTSETKGVRRKIQELRDIGTRMASFCRLDLILKTINQMSQICKSTTLVAKDAVRIPSSASNLGEYLCRLSDQMREACGNAMTGYLFSGLEQYIPLCLMATARIVAEGEGIILKAHLTLQGVEALDRCTSVLYRDLKTATNFHGSFWNVELAAISFERSATFIGLMNLDMDQLASFYKSNFEEFSDEDFELMFSMYGPRRSGDTARFHRLRKKFAHK